MSVEMILNDLSYSLAPNIYEARDRMSKLLAVAKTAANYGVSRTLRTDRSFNEIELAPDYPIARWRNDSDVDRDQIRYLLVLTTKSPFLDDLPHVLDSANGTDFFYGDDRAFGLGVAYLLEGLAISFASADRWCQSLIEIRYESLDLDSNISSEYRQVPHASCEAHIVEHAPWIADRRLEGISSGEDLWTRRHDLYPHLQFCSAVEQQIYAAEKTMLRGIRIQLADLENWARISSDHWDFSLLHNATCESEATINQYGECRTFECPDGEFRLFEWHVRLTPLAWRLHFVPRYEETFVLIGYIGPHLPTAKNP